MHYIIKVQSKTIRNEKLSWKKEDLFMKRAAKQGLIVLLVVMAVIGTGNISAQADYNWKPKKVSIAQSAKKVSQGKEFEIRAKVTPIDAEDDYIRWEIISGKKYVKFEDRDRTGDEMDFIAVKPGKAKIRCYVQGKSKKKYGYDNCNCDEEKE